MHTGGPSSHNLCMALLGGTVVATYLIDKTYNDMAASSYLISGAVISLTFTLTLRETARERLAD